MILTAFTSFHVLISLIGIAAGLVVLAALLQGQGTDRWTAVFFVTTVATSVTGFFFPVARLLPSHVVGLISLVILGVALFARYRRNLAGAWRQTYVVGVMIALYLNVFVAVIQSFLKIPALKALAPTQSEPPFQITQLGVLVLFIGLGVIALIRFRPQHNRN
jgi:hypothetical protein